MRTQHFRLATTHLAGPMALDIRVGQMTSAVVGLRQKANRQRTVAGEDETRAHGQRQARL